MEIQPLRFNLMFQTRHSHHPTPFWGSYCYLRLELPTQRVWAHYNFPSALCAWICQVGFMQCPSKHPRLYCHPFLRYKRHLHPEKSSKLHQRLSNYMALEMGRRTAMRVLLLPRCWGNRSNLSGEGPLVLQHHFLGDSVSGWRLRFSSCDDS